MHTRSIGDIGEGIACTFLRRQGFAIIAQNYRKKWGEIDIIARRNVPRETIHFFEVKSVNVWSLKNIHKNLEIYGHNPEENVHSLKTRHIRRMIETYLNENHNGQGSAFEFHVLCVYMNSKTRHARVKWLKNIVL